MWIKINSPFILVKKYTPPADFLSKVNIPTQIRNFECSLLRLLGKINFFIHCHILIIRQQSLKKLKYATWSDSTFCLQLESSVHIYIDALSWTWEFCSYLHWCIILNLRVRPIFALMHYLELESSAHIYTDALSWTCKFCSYLHWCIILNLRVLPIFTLMHYYLELESSAHIYTDALSWTWELCPYLYWCIILNLRVLPIFTLMYYLDVTPLIMLTSNFKLCPLMTLQYGVGTTQPWHLLPELRDDVVDDQTYSPCHVGQHIKQGRLKTYNNHHQWRLFLD